MDGLKGQPCNPTFVSARDGERIEFVVLIRELTTVHLAIISADACRYGGKYNCTIWKAFAKRGLGQSKL